MPSGSGGSKRRTAWPSGGRDARRRPPRAPRRGCAACRRRRRPGAVLAAQLPDRRAFGRFGGQQRVGEAERVEMGAADGAMPVRHGRQHDDLGVAGEPAIAVGCAVGGGLPVGLDARRSRRAARSLRRCSTSRAARVLGDVAVQAERMRVEVQLRATPESAEGPDEFEHDIVDVEHQQRPVSAHSSAIWRAVSGSSLMRDALRLAHRRRFVAVVALRQRAQRLKHGGRRVPAFLGKSASASAHAPR